MANVIYKQCNVCHILSAHGCATLVLTTHGLVCGLHAHTLPFLVCTCVLNLYIGSLFPFVASCICCWHLLLVTLLLHTFVIPVTHSLVMTFDDIPACYIPWAAAAIVATFFGLPVSLLVTTSCTFTTIQLPFAIALLLFFVTLLLLFVVIGWPSVFVMGKADVLYCVTHLHSDDDDIALWYDDMLYLHTAAHCTTAHRRCTPRTRHPPHRLRLHTLGFFTAGSGFTPCPLLRGTPHTFILLWWWYDDDIIYMHVVRCCCCCYLVIVDGLFCLCCYSLLWWWWWWWWWWW